MRASDRERLAPWTERACDQVRYGAGTDVPGVTVCKTGDWWVYKSVQSLHSAASGRADSLQAAMAAADLAARDIYDLDDLPADAGVTVLVCTCPGATVPVVGDVMVACPVCRKQRVGGRPYIRPPLAPAPHTGRPAVEWSKPADNARPHTTVRDGLDALLRFVLGNPRGEQWMGRERWGEAVKLGRSYKNDGRDPPAHLILGFATILSTYLRRHPRPLDAAVAHDTRGAGIRAAARRDAAGDG